MTGTELGLISAKDFGAANKQVTDLLGKGRGFAAFPYNEGQVIEVFTTKRNAALNSYLVVNLRTTVPETLPNGSEFFPYEGIKVSRIPETESDYHQVSLVSGIKIRNSAGILVDPELMTGNTNTSLEDILLNMDLEDLDQLGTEAALLSQEHGPGDYLSLLNRVDKTNKLDLYGRTLEEGLAEDEVVSDFQQLATQIINRAYTARLIEIDSADGFSFGATFPVKPESGQQQDDKRLSVIRQKSNGLKASGYVHTVFLHGPSLEEGDELYQVRRADGRLGRRLERKQQNPVGPAIGRPIIQKLERVRENLE